jgi:serine palmitoyltransferase
MGSYNYLGFAENKGPIIESVENTIRHYGIGQCTTRHEIGIKLLIICSIA